MVLSMILRYITKIHTYLDRRKNRIYIDTYLRSLPNYKPANAITRAEVKRYKVDIEALRKKHKHLNIPEFNEWYRVE